MKLFKIAVIALGVLALLVSCEEEVQVIEREILRDTVFVSDPNSRLPGSNSLPEISELFQDVFSKTWLDTSQSRTSIYVFDTLDGEYYIGRHSPNTYLCDNPNGWDSSTSKNWFRLRIKTDSIYVHGGDWSEFVHGFELWAVNHIRVNNRWKFLSVGVGLRGDDLSSGSMDYIDVTGMSPCELKNLIELMR